MARAAGLAAAAALLGMGLSGCSAGQVTRTADTQPAIVGVNVASEDETILIRDAAIAFPGPDGYPAGQSAPITMVIVNQSLAPIRLVQAQSELGQATLQTGWVTEAPPSPTPEAGATPTASPAAAQSPAPPATGQAGITIPADGFAQVTVTVSQLRQPVGPVESIPLQLTFDKATVGPFDVPIATPLEPLPRAS